MANQSFDFAPDFRPLAARMRPLTLDEQRLMRTLDRSSVALSGMTWLDRLYVQQRRFPHMERVVERMIRIRDRLLYLARVQ